MHAIGDDFRPQSRRDPGTVAFVVWIAVFAAFMVALMAIGNDDHMLTAHRVDMPAIGVGPA